MDFTMGALLLSVGAISGPCGGGAEGVRLLSACLSLRLTFPFFISTQTFFNKDRDVDFGSGPGELSGRLLVL